MKRKQARLRIRIFYILLLAPTVLWLIFCATGTAKDLDTDTGEKRNKHEIAEGTNLGNLTEELELVYNDNAPFRSALLKMNSSLNYAMETPYRGAILPGLTAIANASMGDSTKWDAGAAADTANTDTQADASASDGTDISDTSVSDDASADPAQPAASEATSDLTPYYETPSEDGYYPYVELAPEVIQGRDGWLFRDESIPDYQGDTLQSDETVASVAADIQTLNEICKQKGIQFIDIALPNKNTVYPEYMPSIEKADYVAMMQLEDYLRANTDVNFTFLNDELLAAKKYGRLYLLTDTHWNGRGAMACTAFLHPLLGLDAIDQGSLQEKPGESYIGDLIYYTGLPVESFAPDTTADYFYKDEITVNQLRGGDDILDEFTSDAPDGRTMVFVGDSYRHHIMQYLNKDFAHTYFINCKNLSAEFTDILNSADILIVENVERNYYVNPDARYAVSDLISLMQ